MADTDVDTPGRLGGRYRVLDEIGRGGMGVVYRVEHDATGNRYAAKVLAAKLHDDPTALRRFQQEVKAATRLGGKHVVKTIDADRDPDLGGAPFLVMELLEGRDLRQELVERGSKLLAGNQIRDQADLHDIVPTDGASTQQECSCPARTDLPDQPGRHHGGADPVVHLRIAQLGVGVGDREVTGGHQAAPAADHRTLDSGDDRDLELPDGDHRSR